MELNHAVLSERLKGLDRYGQLVNYIFNVQGNRIARLNFESAAKALNVDRRTIGRYLKELANRRVVLFHDDKLQLNDEILKTG